MLARVLLRITRSPADVDPRAFMHALWPEGRRLLPRRSGRGSVRSLSQPSDRGRDAGVGAGCGRALAEASAGPGSEEEPATYRGAGRAAGAADRVRAVAVALAVVLAGAIWCGSGRDEGRATPIPTPTPIPTGSPSAVHPERIAGRASGGAESRDDPDPGVEGSGITRGSGGRSTRGAGSPRRCRPGKSLPIAPRLNGLAVPAASSGQGVLSVNAVPWGTVVVNGVRLGEAPLDVRLPAEVPGPPSITRRAPTLERSRSRQAAALHASRAPAHAERPRTARTLISSA